MDGMKAYQLLDQVRFKKPLVHVLINMVTAHSAANALLQVGARPVMADSCDEVVEIVHQADALVLNMGMLNRDKLQAMLAAGNEANRMGIPVVLDPVGVASSGFRIQSLQRILDQVQVSIVRGNASEMGWLAGLSGKSRGVDAADDVPDLIEIARTCARQRKVVAAVTGQEDAVSDGQNVWTIRNGHAMMGLVTGFGCMASAVMGAFAASADKKTEAAIAALICTGVAGQMAAENCQGPGSFLIRFWDCLYNLESSMVKQLAEVEPIDEYRR